MASLISNQEAESQLHKILCNAFMHKLTYNITSWQLYFITDKGQEICIHSAEIEVPDIESWWDGIGSTPVNLHKANEPNDTIAAICLFTIINQWPIDIVKVDKQGNLYLSFTNGCLVKLLAVIEVVDWTWQVKQESLDSIMTCDSGDIYITDDWLVVSEAHV